MFIKLYVTVCLVISIHTNHEHIILLYEFKYIFCFITVQGIAPKYQNKNSEMI